MANAIATNWGHVDLGLCEDPDCEIHRPDVIEDHDARNMALIYFQAGADTFADLLREALKIYPSDEAWRVSTAEFHDQFGYAPD